jgi:hypothetical protein
MRKQSPFLRAVFLCAVSITVSIAVSACVYGATPQQLSNWQDDPKACAEFWDTYFPKALNGDDVAAASLFRAIIQRQLVPPGRPVDEYRQKQMEFDLLALKRLSVHKYRHPTCSPPGSPFTDAGWHIYARSVDPNRVLGKKDSELYGYFISLESWSGGKCSVQTGLDYRADAWAIACRQILADDGVLPSSEAFLETIPEGAKACGYGGAV